MIRKAVFALVVLGVLVVLMFGVLVFHERDQVALAKQHEAKSNVALLAAEVERFAKANGRYPSELAELVQNPAPESKLLKVPMDPWGRPYAYRVIQGQPPEILTYGRDGTKGGAGEDSDVSSLHGAGSVSKS